MPVPFYKPSPAPEAVFQDETIPLEHANIFSRFLYTWISPMLKVGYSRPLQIEDLWGLNENLECQTHAERLQKHFMRRMPPSRRPKISKDDANTTSLNEQLPRNEKTYEYTEKRASDQTRTEKHESSQGDFRSNHPKVKLGEPEPEHIRLYGMNKAKKIAYDNLAIEDGKEYDMSLWYAGYFAFWRPYWTAVIFSIAGQALRVTAPLITKKLIEFLTTSHTYHTAQQNGDSLEGLAVPQSVGHGIGLAIGLFVMQFVPSLLFFKGDQTEFVMGSQLKMALVDLISRKSMRLSGKARNEMDNGRLITLVSSDCNIVEWAMTTFANLVIDPITITSGVSLLIYDLGYSALVGVAVLAIAGPTQWWMVRRFMVFSDRQEQHTDKRVRLLTEILNNVRAVKSYAYERFFGQKVSDIRRDELYNLRGKALLRAAMTAILNVIPMFAAILTFVTYGLTGHELTASVIFSGLQWFSVIRVPITLLPMTLAAVGDMTVSLRRIRRTLKADELEDTLNINPELECGIDVKADFRYDPSPKYKSGDKTEAQGEAIKGENVEKSRKEKRAEAKIEKAKTNKRKKLGLPMDVDPDEEDLDIPFSLSGVDLKIPRGALVCVVGRVGTGKTTLLHGLINEVRRINGHVSFGGRVGYVPQQAWVQSGTVRDNITFASNEVDIDQKHIDETVFACALQTDIENWEQGDRTTVGEKGITLSGGQRQRLCLARAASDQSEVVLLDDPLSAVDAAVGHHLLENCILNGPFANRTRILVTHHLDVLPKADLVLVMDRVSEHEGRIVQQGTYNELRSQEGIFRSLMNEFGAIEKHDQQVDTDTEQRPAEELIDDQRSSSSKEIEAEDGADLPEDKSEERPQNTKTDENDTKEFMDEERVTGNVTWGTYKAYFGALDSPVYIVLCSASLLLTQASSIGNSLFLGFWTGSSIDGFSQGEYMGVYGGLGAAQALFNFATVFSIALAGMRASFNLFNGGWNAVMRSPVTWHDQTPTGRIISRLSKDIRILDDRFTMIWYQLLSNTLIIVGTMGLIIYTYPWLGFMFIPLGCAFYLCTAFYTKTSRELKRVESLIRSNWYTAFSEQLAGLAVIRAFGRQETFQSRLQHGLNQEQQAYILTITCQRWLSVRLEALSQGIILLIGIIGVVNRNHVSPERFGVVFTYALQSAYIFTLFVPLWAQCEQDMNCVERLHHYNTLASEALPFVHGDPKFDEWPREGSIEFDRVCLRYRPELPVVLNDLSFTIRPGEKIGIIGRTGAGKSSVAQALFRTVELDSCKIVVDGVNLKDLGLETLRSRIAIIPQDAFLFAGTIRDNLDFSSSRSDAELNEALNLIRNHPRVSANLRDKLKLDSTVAPEGSNFSAGEKELLSLIRALSRRCKILLLDEATSSVDPETDALIQGIIQTEFSDVTLLSIAHRPQTVAYYDRILVLDKGQVKEFDTPLRLFDDETSTFRDLCDKRHIGREDLVRIKQEAESAKKSKTTHTSTH